MFTTRSQCYDVFFSVDIRTFVFDKRLIVVDIVLDTFIVARGGFVKSHQLLGSTENLG